MKTMAKSEGNTIRGTKEGASAVTFMLGIYSSISRGHAAIAWNAMKHRKSWRLRKEQPQRKEKKERRRLNVRVDFHRDLGLQAQRASFDRSVVSREQ